MGYAHLSADAAADSIRSRHVVVNLAGRLQDRSFIMHLVRTALVAASLVVMGCSSDDATSPNGSTQFETRLAAAASEPITGRGGELLTLDVAVTNTLPETVSGGICAQTVQARTVSGTAWTNVTSETAVCSALAVIVPVGGTVTFKANADAAKVRTVLGGSTGTVLFRVQHSLAGASTSYMVQSNTVTWTTN